MRRFVRAKTLFRHKDLKSSKGNNLKGKDYMMGGHKQAEYIAFLDECGDHSLSKIDQDFPIFVLSLILVKRSDYRDIILPAINHFKLRYWDHEGVNLHSRDIRKASGSFSILQHPERRKTFIEELSTLMNDLPYELFIVGIRKQRLCDQYIHAMNPYDLAIIFLMERLIGCLKQRGQTELPIIAESRGRNEDNSLKAAIFDLINKGTKYVTKERFEQHSFPIQFHDKRTNITGIQLADLCAYPSSRYILKPDQPNRSFETVKRHIYQGGGWKLFP